MKAIARRVLATAWASASGRKRAIHRAQQRLDKLAACGCRFLIVIPYLKSGGAERVAANLAQAFVDLHGPKSVAVLVTDWSGLTVSIAFPENVATSYPPGVPFVDVVALSHAPHVERVWDIMSAITSMRPELVLNVNSELLWECFERFGPEMARTMRLGTVAFCHATNKHGDPVGYSVTHLERMLPFLDFVISDNATYIDELRQTLIAAPIVGRVPTRKEWAAAKLIACDPEGIDREPRDLAKALDHAPTEAEWVAARVAAEKLPRPGLDDAAAAKLRCIYQHTRPAKKSAVKIRTTRRQILWASRVSRSKFPELLPRIARLMPDCDIHAYGSRELGYRFPMLKSLLFPDYDLGNAVAKAPNLYWHGGFKSFASLPLERFDAFLYTGLYDGIPNVLLEAGTHRLPIVAPLIGGIGELIKEATGWPVCNPYDAREYAERLREALEAPAAAVARADALASLIAQRHSFEAFCRSVSELVTACQGRVTAYCAAPASSSPA